MLNTKDLVINPLRALYQGDLPVAKWIRTYFGTDRPQYRLWSSSNSWFWDCDGSWSGLSISRRRTMTNSLPIACRFCGLLDHLEGGKTPSHSDPSLYHKFQPASYWFGCWSDKENLKRNLGYFLYIYAVRRSDGTFNGTNCL